MLLATIVYIIDPDTHEVLMAKKTRKVGVGYFFGYGGKIKEGETPEECTYRETHKESGYAIKLDTTKLERVALMDFYNSEKLDPKVDEPVFRVLCYRIFQRKADLGGIPITTNEMADPTWFPIDAIPFGTDQMKPGDELFVPQIIAGTPIKGYVHFTDDSKRVISSFITPCVIEDLVI